MLLMSVNRQLCYSPAVKLSKMAQYLRVHTVKDQSQEMVKCEIKMSNALIHR